MWPVIERELRGESRHGFTYWLRVLGAATMLLVTFGFLIGTPYEFTQGGKLFALQHLLLFCAIWILVPFLVSDSISREKREGTIGLLFLTPLSARDIVVAKSLAHGVRAFSLWLAVVPILTLPFLIGGVSWREVLFSAGILFNSFIWAIAAGLLASSRSKSWMRALLLASILAFVCFLGFILLNDWIFRVTSDSIRLYRAWNDSTFGSWLEESFVMATGLDELWTELFSTGPGRTQPQLYLALGYTAMCSLLGFWIILRLAARNLQRTWQEGPPTAGQVWFNHHLCTPVFWLGFFKGWMRRKLERNPVGWLEQRTWSSRITTWAWLAVTISVISYGLAGLQYYTDSFQQLVILFGTILLIHLVISSVGSFRRERETGVLELLLVTPLSERQIIRGRLSSLWGKFLPSTILLLGVSFYISLILRGLKISYQESYWQFVQLGFFASSFCTLPVIGLYYSLRCAHFITALLSTLLVGFGVPLLTLIGSSIFLEIVGRPYANSWIVFLLSAPVLIFIVPVATQVFLAGLHKQKLYRNLVRRTFTLGKASA